MGFVRGRHRIGTARGSIHQSSVALKSPWLCSLRKQCLIRPRLLRGRDPPQTALSCGPSPSAPQVAPTLLQKASACRLSPDPGRYGTTLAGDDQPRFDVARGVMALAHRNGWPLSPDEKFPTGVDHPWTRYGWDFGLSKRDLAVVGIAPNPAEATSKHLFGQAVIQLRSERPMCCDAAARRESKVSIRTSGSSRLRVDAVARCHKSAPRRGHCVATSSILVQSG